MGTVPSGALAVVRFLSEIGLAIGVWSLARWFAAEQGWHGLIGAALGVLLIAAMATLWAFRISPQSPRRQTGWRRLSIEIPLVALAASGLLLRDGALPAGLAFALWLVGQLHARDADQDYQRFSTT